MRESPECYERRKRPTREIASDDWRGGGAGVPIDPDSVSYLTDTERFELSLHGANGGDAQGVRGDAPAADGELRGVLET